MPIIDPETGMKKSRAGRWRLYVLGAVHVLMIGHFLHWLWADQTLTPIEPSESMETIRQGYINMGFIFFSLAILATLILGRWVCGWGCHLVAYQDLTLWLLKKLRLRPKPFRTRFLLNLQPWFWRPAGCFLFRSGRASGPCLSSSRSQNLRCISPAPGIGTRFPVRCSAC
ncbi:MAG: 4Fe-4S binding protein [Planctomycetes bacterium]|nr:4Fe-4S binding protein [Planctomycetota bacterium]